MEVKLFMAQTVNSKIARKDGSEDFLSSRNWKEFRQIAEDAGIFLVGRKTYEEVSEWESKGFKDVEAERLVLSRQKGLELQEGFRHVRSPREAIKLSGNEGYSSLLVTGGASVNSAFIKKDMIDQIILNIEPYVLSEGLDLFSEAGFEAQLELLEVRELENSIVQLSYRL